MRIVFLDIDGVTHPVSGGTWFRPSCMAALNRIVTTTNASIVLSSSWRLMPPNRIRVEEALMACGMASFISVTASGSLRSRGDEVALWLREHASDEVLSFVALDDIDLTKHAVLVNNAVVTDPAVGLTEADADLAVAILMGTERPPPPPTVKKVVVTEVATTERGRPPMELTLGTPPPPPPPRY